MTRDARSDREAPLHATLVASWERRAIPLRIAARVVRALRLLRLRAAGARLGRGVHLGAGASVVGAPGLRLEDEVRIGRRARIEIHAHEGGRGRLEIGARTRLMNDAHLGAAVAVEIGADCLIAAGCAVLDHDHDFSDPLDATRRNRGLVASPVRIADHVFLGERVTVLKGVSIGRGSVVGAHAVVTADVPPFTMVAGVPARPVARYDVGARRWIRIP
ncbi:MAG: hypothetical protein RIS86_1963 [Planctomycetota bacterium]